MKKFLPLFALAIVLTAAIALRAAHLRADAPERFPNGTTESALTKDEAAKGLAPRNRALFGAWSPNPADDYRFWETLSPAWVWPLSGWFQLIGPSYVAARAYSIFWSGISIAVVYLILRRKSEAAALIAAALFALNFYAVIYGRLGLLETSLNGFLLLAFAGQAESEERPGFLAGAALCWLAAWFVKQNAVVYLPVLVLGAAWPFLKKGERQKSAGLGAAAVLLAIAIAAACFLSPDYRIRSIMNVRHALDYPPDVSRLWMQVDLGRTWLAVQANLTAGLFRGYFLMMPVVGTLAALEILFTLRDLCRRRTEFRSVLAALWLLSARAVLTFQGLAVPRFDLIQLPPALLLAGLALARLHNIYVRPSASPAAAKSRRLRFALFTVLLLLASMWIQLLPWAIWVKDNPREIERGNLELRRLIGARPAVVVGEWAGPLAFDSPYQYFYLKSVFNRTPEQVAALSITHLLVEAKKEEGEDMDPAVRRLKKYFPSAYDQRKEIGRIKLWPGTAREEDLILYQIRMGTQ